MAGAQLRQRGLVGTEGALLPSPGGWRGPGSIPPAAAGRFSSLLGGESGQEIKGRQGPAGHCRELGAEVWPKDSSEDKCAPRRRRHGAAGAGPGLLAGAGLGLRGGDQRQPAVPGGPGVADQRLQPHGGGGGAGDGGGFAQGQLTLLPAAGPQPRGPAAEAVAAGHGRCPLHDHQRAGAALPCHVRGAAAPGSPGRPRLPAAAAGARRLAAAGGGQGRLPRLRPLWPPGFPHPAALQLPALPLRRVGHPLHPQQGLLRQLLPLPQQHPRG